MTDVPAGPPTDPVAELRRALQERDARAVAVLLATVPVGVLVRDGLPQVTHDDGLALPVFLSSDSVDAFGSDADLRLLRAQELPAVLAATGVDRVLFDPALPSAIAVPAGVVADLLPGQSLPGGSTSSEE